MKKTDTCIGQSLVGRPACATTLVEADIKAGRTLVETLDAMDVEVTAAL